MRIIEKRKEQAVLVFVYIDESTQEREMRENELAALIKSVGGEVYAILTQSVKKYSPATVMGRGKLEELASFVENEEVDLVVFDEPLTGAQLYNIREVLSCKVLDRMELILDIFALRARTGRSKLEVRLAQLEYRLPRLKGIGTDLSRLGAGIGTRGPGETQLETDRRTILREIDAAKTQLAKIRGREYIALSYHRSSSEKTVSLVGYTNAGKSTILNGLVSDTEKSVFADDRLFATLDIRLRRVTPAHDPPFLLADTVGFIRDLPKKLEESFTSTLEEITYSDLVLVVVDGSHPHYEQQIESVHRIAGDYLKGREILYVMNKGDKGQNPLVTPKEDTIRMSAKSSSDLLMLTERICEILYGKKEERRIMLPYRKMDVFTRLKDRNAVEDFVYSEDGVEATVILRESEWRKWENEIPYSV